MKSKYKKVTSEELETIQEKLAKNSMDSRIRLFLNPNTEDKTPVNTVDLSAGKFFNHENKLYIKIDNTIYPTAEVFDCKTGYYDSFFAHTEVVPTVSHLITNTIISSALQNNFACGEYFIMNNELYLKIRYMSVDCIKVLNVMKQEVSEILPDIKVDLVEVSYLEPV